MRVVALRDEDAGAHRGSAVTPVVAVSVDLAAVADGSERGLRAEDQFRNREREEGTVNALQPQRFDGRDVRVGLGRGRETHVDDETHAEVAQGVVVAGGGSCANEEVVGDGREVHAGNGITGGKVVGVQWVLGFRFQVSGFKFQVSGRRSVRMADNAFVKILTALLKHQVKKVVGDETLGVIGQEIAALGGDKVDDQIKSWLGEKTNAEQLEKAAQTAQACFREKVTDNEIQQWMVSLPLGNLPKVVEAIDELPTSADESKLENALRESVALNWRKLSSEQVDHAVSSFLSCLRSALLPIEKQTLMIIGRSVLRTEDKVDLLIRWFEQYIITGKPVEIKQLNPQLDEEWNLAHPYPMPPNFTGRVKEWKMLTDWLNKENENRLFILRALGGFGKSALTWHWLTHDVDATEWKKVVFWSFYEGDASFEHFIEDTLKYLKLDVPQGGRPQVDTLLKEMQSQKILLIMDGFERALRAYNSMNAAYQGDSDLPSFLGEGQGNGAENGTDCININAEIFLKSVCSLTNVQSKVLMTTRITPRAVKLHGELMLGCREVELTAMQPADAVEFFHKQKIKGTHAEIEAACLPYGYHPLSLRILAGLIVNDRENPGDVIVANHINITDDIVANKKHVLEVAYNTLSKEQQEFLSTIACFRAPTTYDALKYIATEPLSSSNTLLLSKERRDMLDRHLKILETRGLLHWDRRINKYDLHPIVRRYAYERLNTYDRNAAHTRLINYFDAVDAPATVHSINDLDSTIELYHHTVSVGNYYLALQIYHDRLANRLYRELGEYQREIELLTALIKDGEWQINGERLIWALNALATSYSLNGQSKLAIQIMEHSIKEDLWYGRAIGFGNLAQDQALVGYLKSAYNNTEKKLSLCKHTDAAIGHQELGQILLYMGKLEEAEKEFANARDYFEKNGHSQLKNTTEVYYALLSLHIMRKERYQPWGGSQTHLYFTSDKASDFIQESNPIENKISPKLLGENKNIIGSRFTSKYETVRAYWLAGALLRMNGNLTSAENHLNHALAECRSINLLEVESNVLLDIARLSFDYGLASSAQDRLKHMEQAKSLADEALLITERCGYVLQGADVNLFLAELALTLDPSPEGRGKARGFAEEALKLATCDGPPYYYKVAYEEAERLLERLEE